ncbi:hypothetical protein MTO96_015063 [Rhipicephalus appendiculatus]
MPPQAGVPPEQSYGVEPGQKGLDGFKRAGIIYGQAQVAVAITILLLVVISISLLLLTESPSVGTTAADYPSLWDDPSPTTPEGTAIPASSKASPKPTTASKLTRRYKFSTAPLVCVYGSGFNESLEFPEEGLCDLTVFDSLYKDDRNPWPEPDQDLLHFLSAARRQRNSQFGLSFDYRNWRKLSEELSDGNPTKHIDDYWFDRIYHYGMVDISPYTETEVEVAKIVALFKRFYELLAEQSYESGFGQHTIIFFGFSPLNHRWISFVPSLFSTFRPHLFVIRGHYSLINNNESDCRIVAPTFQSRVAGTYFSLSNAHGALKYVAQTVPEDATMLAVSASAAGRWNRPQNYLRHQASNYRFLEKCTKLPQNVQQFGNMYEICSRPGYNQVYDRAYKAEYRYNFDDGLLFSYDTSESLKEKLCYYKTNLTSIPPYGLALFDMQYEDWIGVCFGEKFGRLRALRRLLDFLTERFRFASDFTECLFSTRAQ